jgi:hypothetical protein
MEPNKKGVAVPATAIKLSELDGLPLEMHALPRATVIISGEMEAMELLKTAETLSRFSGELLMHLAKVCGAYDHCGESDGLECPMVDCSGTPAILVPAWALDEADIPRDAKLTCDANEETGEIRVMQADYEYDITDVSLPFLEVFRRTGVCLGELEEHLMVEDIVYG